MGCESFKRPEIINKDNRVEFCEVFGGRARYWNPRFCFDERAIETRDLMIKLAHFGENYKSLVEKLNKIDDGTTLSEKTVEKKLINRGRTTLSYAVGGTAGKTLGKDGKSTTDRILYGLRNILNEYQGPNQYSI